MRWFISLALGVGVGLYQYAMANYEDCLPEPSSQHLLYLLSPQATSLLDAATIEASLRKWYDSGLQMVVIVTDTLCGMDIAMYANAIGERWGVGKEKKDNGIVIVMVPKAGNRKGKLFIAPGRGIQGVLPDAYVKRLAQQTARNYFMKGKITEGLTILIQRLGEKVLSEQEEVAEELYTDTYEHEAAEESLLSGAISIITELLKPLFTFWGLLLFLLSLPILGYIMGYAGKARSNIGHNTRGVIKGFYEAFMTGISWALSISLLALFSGNELWIPASFVIALIAFLAGFLVLWKYPEFIDFLCDKTYLFLLPLLPVGLQILPVAMLLKMIAQWIFLGETDVKVSLVGASSGTSSSGGSSYSGSDYSSSSSSSSYSSGGSSGGSITFGGGRFNGGGAGAEW